MVLWDALPLGVDAAYGLNRSVECTAAHVLELNTEAERLHGVECLIYCDAGHIGIDKLSELQACVAEFRIAMKHVQRMVLLDLP